MARRTTKAVAPVTTSAPSKLLTWAGRCWLVGAFAAAAAVGSTNYPLIATLPTGAVAGVVALVIIAAWRKLEPPLGKQTAGAAICLACGLLVTIVSVAMPTCPGESAGRCTAGQTITWASVGAIAPIALIVTAAIPWLGGRVLLSAGRVVLQVARKVRARRSARRVATAS